MAPGYLSALCQLVSGVPGRRHLRPAGHGELDFFPRVNLSTYGGRVFTYAGPTCWNSLPDNPKNVNLSLQTFKRETFSFPHNSTFSAFEVSYKNALYKLLTRSI